MKNMKKLILTSITAMLAIGMASDAWALSQWSRKYGVSCTTCHSAFPRLNAYGDAFMQNGYQTPGSEDGDTDGKTKIADGLNLNQLPDILGIRVSLTPIDFKTNVRKKADGSYDDRLNAGKVDWVQIFTGGTIMKNVSVFIETEVLTDEVEINWFHMGFHNLAGLGSYGNIRVGRLSAFNWHALTGRLRAIPPVKNEIFTYKSSNGKGDDSVAIASPYPAVEYYGYNKYGLLAVGVQNGAKATDPNDKKNYYGTIKVWLARGGTLEGSSLSVGGLIGTDTKALSATTNAAGVVTAAAEAENSFQRAGPALNIRLHEATDLQVAYFVGSDDNWKLVGPGGQETKVDVAGLSAILGQWLNEKWWCAVQYDQIDSDDNDKDFEKATATIYFFPRENLRVGLIGRADLDDVGEDINETTASIRAMF